MDESGASLSSSRTSLPRDRPPPPTSPPRADARERRRESGLFDLAHGLGGRTWKLNGMETPRLQLRPVLAGLAALGLAAGLVAPLAGLGAWSGAIWTAATVPVLLALLAEIVTSLRRGDVGLDIVAALSMTAALAVGQTLAGAIVALMYAGGQYLEGFAEKRARREMTALLARVPRTALRHRDRAPGGGAARADRARRPAAGPPGRRGAGRRHRGRGRGGARPVGAHRQIAAGPAARRRGGHERLDQCRRRLRPHGLAPGRGEHLCRHRPPGRGGAALTRADGAYGRPLRHRLPGRDRRACRRRLVAHRRPDPRRGRAGGGDALSADPGRAGRHRRRPVARRQARHPDQGRQGDRGACRGCARW